eukprot:2742156-Rhodomonas_salina.1
MKLERLRVEPRAGLGARWHWHVPMPASSDPDDLRHPSSPQENGIPSLILALRSGSTRVTAAAPIG